MERLFSAIGFCGHQDLLASLWRPKSAPMLASISMIGAGVEYAFGLKPFMFTALFILLLVELITGLTAAKLKGRKLTSRRMQRFGVMILVWFTLLLALNALTHQYKGQAEEHVAHYMHSTLVFYIIGVYFKSILENAENIWKNKLNARVLISQLFKTNKDETNNTSR